MTMNACHLCPYRQQPGGKRRVTFPPDRAERKLGMKWGLKPDGGEWPDTQTRVSEDGVELAQVRRRQWAGQAGHDSISKEDSHTHYILFILESTGCDIWHLPVSVRHILSGLCALAVVSLGQSSAPDSSHAVRATYSDSCAGLDSQMETLSLLRVTLPQARVHMEENSHIW